MLHGQGNGGLQLESVITVEVAVPPRSSRVSKEYGARVSATWDGEVASVSANRSGLVDLAVKCLTLAGTDPDMAFMEFDEYGYLEDGSCDLALVGADSDECGCLSGSCDSAPSRRGGLREGIRTCRLSIAIPPSSHPSLAARADVSLDDGEIVIEATPDELEEIAGKLLGMAFGEREKAPDLILAGTRARPNAPTVVVRRVPSSATREAGGRVSEIWRLGPWRGLEIDSPDFAWGPDGTPLLSARAIDALGDLLGGCELGARRSDGMRPVSRVAAIDCMDWGGAGVERGPAGRILWVWGYRIDSDRIPGVCGLFRISGEGSGAIYASSLLVDRAEAFYLAGFSFELVWRDVSGWNEIVLESPGGEGLHVVEVTPYPVRIVREG